MIKYKVVYEASHEGMEENLNNDAKLFDSAGAAMRYCAELIDEMQEESNEILVGEIYEVEDGEEGKYPIFKVEPQIYLNISSNDDPQKLGNLKRLKMLFDQMEETNG